MLLWKKKKEKKEGEPRQTGPRQTCLKVTDCAGVPGGRWGGRDNGYLCLSRGTRRQLFSCGACALVRACVCVSLCVSLLWRRISKSSPTSLYIIAITDICRRVCYITSIFFFSKKRRQQKENRTEQRRDFLCLKSFEVPNLPIVVSVVVIVLKPGKA